MAAQEDAVRWDPSRFRSTRLKALYTRARRFAHLKVPVLILGERGTGKTTLASWIRANSRYRKEALDQSWPAVACGQYGSDTMRSELFGHVKGAFTNAHRKRDGLLLSADGDTLFLDEIGDISRDVQRLLIKALEEKSFRPMGSDEVIQSDFRLICATNRERSELEQRLDSDFLDRVASLTLRVPALREIPEDLDWIWEQVYDQAIQRAAVDARSVYLSPVAVAPLIEGLRGHPLPGNLRDLFQLAYMVIASRADPVEPAGEVEAVELALEEFESAPRGAIRDLPRAVAAAFVESRSLSAAGVTWPLSTKSVLDSIRRYLGWEILAEAKRSGKEVEALCIDPGRRRLQDWKKLDP